MAKSTQREAWQLLVFALGGIAASTAVISAIRAGVFLRIDPVYLVAGSAFVAIVSLVLVLVSLVAGFRAAVVDAQQNKTKRRLIDVYVWAMFALAIVLIFAIWRRQLLVWSEI